MSGLVDLTLSTIDGSVIEALTKKFADPANTGVAETDADSDADVTETTVDLKAWRANLCEVGSEDGLVSGDSLDAVAPKAPAPASTRSRSSSSASPAFSMSPGGGYDIDIEISSDKTLLAGDMPELITTNDSPGRGGADGTGGEESNYVSDEANQDQGPDGFSLATPVATHTEASGVGFSVSLCVPSVADALSTGGSKLESKRGLLGHATAGTLSAGTNELESNGLLGHAAERGLLGHAATDVLSAGAIKLESKRGLLGHAAAGALSAGVSLATGRPPDDAAGGALSAGAIKPAVRDAATTSNDALPLPAPVSGECALSVAASAEEEAAAGGEPDELEQQAPADAEQRSLGEPDGLDSTTSRELGVPLLAGDTPAKPTLAPAGLTSVSKPPAPIGPSAVMLAVHLACAPPAEHDEQQWFECGGDGSHGEPEWRAAVGSTADHNAAASLGNLRDPTPVTIDDSLLEAVAKGFAGVDDAAAPEAAADPDDTDVVEATVAPKMVGAVVPKMLDTDAVVPKMLDADDSIDADSLADSLDDVAPEMLYADAEQCALGERNIDCNASATAAEPGGGQN
jgi:hypothetical protein